MISGPDDQDKYLRYLETLTPEQRVLAMGHTETVYCRHCGFKQPAGGRCQCNRDPD